MMPPIFKAYDVRATYPDKLNEAAAWKVGLATGTFLATQPNRPAGKNAGSVVVTRDMRPHSPPLAEALIEGLRASGLGVIDLGMCDTSFQYFAINFLGTSGGVQVTASHNPINYNGFKISGPQARPIGADTGLKEIEKIANTLGERGSKPATGTLQTMDLWREYRAHIHKFLNPPPAAARPLKVFIDASNGMAGKLVPKVFEGIPNLEIIPINFDFNAKWAHEPNPLVAENMKPTQEGVLKHKADLGVCFDGDADRCILTDEKGEIIGCDHLTALLAGYFLGASRGSVVIYDLRSSKAVEEAVRGAGGVPVKSRVGHVFMKALLRETSGIFGGELSGHFYFRDNFCTDSGAIAFAAALSVLTRMGKPMSELVAPFKRYPQSGEINFRAEDKAGIMAGLKTQYGASGKVEELDGVSVDAWEKLGWWFNVRASNTEPLLRLNAEAKDKATLAKLLAELTPKLGTPDTGHH
ncbi:MAG: phosphomannomutase/phosphoglucomutase [Planctomycetes bacterium]|nr:phosphomannomutase/phosphoglucomutase [Planctomycetota bacterium]